MHKIKSTTIDVSYCIEYKRYGTPTPHKQTTNLLSTLFFYRNNHLITTCNINWTIEQVLFSLRPRHATAVADTVVVVVESYSRLFFRLVLIYYSHWDKVMICAIHNALEQRKSGERARAAIHMHTLVRFWCTCEGQRTKLVEKRLKPKQAYC